jgi:hypothetical protein
MSNINEDAVLGQFNYYRQELNLNVQEAAEQLLEDCIDEEDMSDEDLEYVVETLIPEIIVLFAETYDSMTNCYDYSDDEDDLTQIFETWAKFEGLSENLQNEIADTIDEFVKHNDPDNDQDGDGKDEDGDGQSETADFIFKDNEWNRLSDSERQAKIKRFLKKLATAHLDMKNTKYLQHFGRE